MEGEGIREGNERRKGKNTLARVFWIYTMRKDYKPDQFVNRPPAYKPVIEFSDWLYKAKSSQFTNQAKWFESWANVYNLLDGWKAEQTACGPNSMEAGWTIYRNI